MAGCTVLGTCSSESKVEFLKSIGCDRPINYKTENLGAVLKKEFPRGYVNFSSSFLILSISLCSLKTNFFDTMTPFEYFTRSFRSIDVVYESVGGETFETCVKHLATCGVLIVIGAVSQYQDQTAWDSSKGTDLSTPLSSNKTS